MVKVLIKVSYSAKGLQGLLAEGATGRIEAIGSLVASVGGRMESLHYAYGPCDVYLIAEVPDHPTVVALAATIGASEAIASYETVILIDPADVDAASSVTVGYRAPGA
jgi:uncharacterized protein with GYD domain